MLEKFSTQIGAVETILDRVEDGTYTIENDGNVFWLHPNEYGMPEETSVYAETRSKVIRLCGREIAKSIGYDWAFEKPGLFDEIQDHLDYPVKPRRPYKDIASVLVCADDSTMSVQASSTHYSVPRSNDGPYLEVEVWLCGYVPAWSEYGDGEDPYSYLPINLVVEEVARRGGIRRL